MAVRFDKFTLKAQEAVQRAQELALNGGHPQVDTLHLLAGLLAWLVPPIALTLGILAVVGALRYMRRGAPEGEKANVEVSAEDEELLREAMKEMDSSEEPVF